MAFVGVILKRSADSGSLNFSTNQIADWNTELIDTDAFHDTVTNNSRITIPSSVNGKYGIFHASIGIGSLAGTDQTNLIILQRNGSQIFNGTAGQICTNDQGSDIWMTIETCPLLLTTGDYYEIIAFSHDTTAIWEATYSSFALYVVT
jgi:hypothetical protein